MVRAYTDRPSAKSNPQSSPEACKNNAQSRSPQKVTFPMSKYNAQHLQCKKTKETDPVSETGNTNPEAVPRPGLPGKGFKAAAVTRLPTIKKK